MKNFDLSFKQIFWSEKTEVVSVVMPVFNQQDRIESVLDDLEASMSLHHELIIIDDCSEDNSNKIIRNWLATRSQGGLLTQARIFTTTSPSYETAADNIGFRAASAEYVLELQADITVKDLGFDQRMIAALEQLKLASVSGRMVHLFASLDSRRRYLKYPIQALKNRLKPSSAGIGRLGRDFFYEPQSLEKGVCYVGETVARGPWLLKREMLEKHNFLDENHFFLGFDDHDLHRRIFVEDRQLPGYVPVNCWSPENAGSTRRARTGENEKIYRHLKATKAGSPDFIRFMENYKPFAPITKKYFDLGKRSKIFFTRSS